MDSRQNPTVVTTKEVDLRQVDDDMRYQVLIDYKAVNGLITDQEGNMRKMPMTELADGLGCNRDTLYEWMKRPDFWLRVSEARKSVSSKSRLAKVHEVMYLSALKPGPDGYRDRVLYLANFDDKFRMPTEKLQVEAGDSWAAIYEKNNSKFDGEILEGEIVDADKAD